MLNLHLISSLIRREIVARYRGSLFGLLWSLLNPLFMLAVYTFVFGVVMNARWSRPSQPADVGSTTEFAVILFAGLIIFQFFADVTTQAAGLIVSNASYVKKIVFPVHVLTIVSTGAALFHAFVSFLVLLVFERYVFGSIPLTILLAPIVFAPFVLLVLGIGWFVAAMGVYFRDTSQIIQPVVTATMFLSPVLFSAASAPEAIRSVLFLNPLTVPVENFRNVVVFGIRPDWSALGIYAVVAAIIAVLGYQFFQKTRKGFADVL